MNEKSSILSVDAWLALAEPQLPILRNSDEKGSIYTVSKVGFLAAPQTDCTEKGIQARKIPDNKCLLPTGVLDVDGKNELCRLPVDLGKWLESCVAMAHSGMNPFPSEVEFGILDGRAYAEFLI